MPIRRTKIVATIGPASDSPAMLRALADAGMNMARISLSHGSLEEAVARMHRVRDVAHGCAEGYLKSRRLLGYPLLGAEGKKIAEAELGAIAAAEAAKAEKAAKAAAKNAAAPKEKR